MKKSLRKDIVTYHLVCLLESLQDQYVNPSSPTKFYPDESVDAFISLMSMGKTAIMRKLRRGFMIHMEHVGTWEDWYGEMEAWVQEELISLSKLQESCG